MCNRSGFGKCQVLRKLIGQRGMHEADAGSDVGSIVLRFIADLAEGDDGLVLITFEWRALGIDPYLNRLVTDRAECFDGGGGVEDARQGQRVDGRRGKDPFVREMQGNIGFDRAERRQADGLFIFGEVQRVQRHQFLQRLGIETGGRGRGRGLHPARERGEISFPAAVASLGFQALLDGIGAVQAL